MTTVQRKARPADVARAIVTAAALPAWQRLNAALIGVNPPCADDPDQWFEKDSGPAIAACRPCPARTACGEYAAAAGERSGVWGGNDHTRTGELHQDRARPTSTTTERSTDQ